VQALNQLYRREPSLYEMDCESGGFEWIDANDALQSVISFVRKGSSTDDITLVVCNFTPMTHFQYRVGAPRGGVWKELLNSDANEYGGSGQDNLESLQAIKTPTHGRPYTIVYFKSRRRKQ
jgi:1,4-alpha-glucan branching enzyme